MRNMMKMAVDWQIVGYILFCCEIFIPRKEQMMTTSAEISFGKLIVFAALVFLKVCSSQAIYSDYNESSTFYT